MPPHTPPSFPRRREPREKQSTPPIPHDRFELSVGMAGFIAGLFGLINLFARTQSSPLPRWERARACPGLEPGVRVTGRPVFRGVFGDKFGIKYGLRGRVMVLGLLVLLLEGIALVIFSQMATLFLAIGAMLIFSLFVQMSEGATFSVVPFINRRSHRPRPRRVRPWYRNP